MVAYLFEMTGRVPRTETEIYTAFTRFSLMRSLTNHNEIDNLNEQEECLFKQICRLAFEKTILNKQVLQQDEVSSYFKREKVKDVSLDLIAIDPTAGLYGFKDVYTFLHLTFQEYLAACFLSTLSIEEQVQLLRQHGDKYHMLVASVEILLWFERI